MIKKFKIKNGFMRLQYRKGINKLAFSVAKKKNPAKYFNLHMPLSVFSCFILVKGDECTKLSGHSPAQVLPHAGRNWLYPSETP